MSHSATKNDTHGGHDTKGDAAHTASTAAPKAGAKAAAPRDAAADQLRLLGLLAADWLNNDRTHATEIAALLASLTYAQGPPVNVDVPFASLTGGGIL